MPSWHRGSLLDVLHRFPEDQIAVNLAVLREMPKPDPVMADFDYIRLFNGGRAIVRDLIQLNLDRMANLTL